MDKQARKLNTPKEDGAPSEAGSEDGSNNESDHEEKVQYNFLRCRACEEEMNFFQGMYVINFELSVFFVQYSLKVLEMKC